MVEGSTLVVIAVPLIIAGIIVYTYLKSNADYIKANWVQYRCNPLYMPVAGMFGADVFKNFQFCIGSIASSLFGYALGPIYTMFGLFTKMIKGILGQLNKFRAFVLGMMAFITSYFAETIGRLSNTFGTLIHLLSIVRDLSKRILASAAYTVNIMTTGINLILATFDFTWILLKTLTILVIALAIILFLVFPPLLIFFIVVAIMIDVGSGDKSCFHPDTPVQMASGQIVPISTIKVGEVLANNAKVTGTMRFTPTDPMYIYRSVACVSGSHIVRDSDGVWRKVEDSMNSVPYTGPPLDEIICLRTSHQKIYIYGCTFADYDEIKPSGNPPQPLAGTDTIRRASDNAKVELRDCYPGLETTCGVLRCVMQLENNTYQVIVNNPEGRLYINDSTWVSDYLGAEHDPDVYRECHTRAMTELNRDILNNVRHQG